MTLLVTLFISVILPESAHARRKRRYRKKKVKKADSYLVFIDTTHDAISQEILALSNRIDSFFGDERIDDEANTTRIRIFHNTTINEGDTPLHELGYRIQLKLPRTEKKLQLVVQRDENEDEPGAANVPRQQGTEGARENLSDNTTAGLRYILDVADIKFSSDAGIRVDKWPPQAFARFRFRKNIRFGRWMFRPVEKLLWIDREGWFSQTDLNFDNRLNDAWLFRYVNKFLWDNVDYVLRYQTGPTWFQKISDSTGISYSAISFWEDEPGWAVHNYAFSAGFRQLIYKQWFFWEVTPTLSFPRENSFHRTPGATIKLEAIFGRI